MVRRAKGAVRKGAGSMCKICGLNCGKGGPLSTHIEGKHQVSYENYKKCFSSGTLVTDVWDDTVSTSSGKTFLIHVLVRKFVGDTGPRGAPRSPRPQKL